MEIVRYEPKEPPDERFYDVLNELRSIGHNVNQIARNANAGFIDEPYYIRQVDKLNNILDSLKDKYLMPDEKK